MYFLLWLETTSYLSRQYKVRVFLKSEVRFNTASAAHGLDVYFGYRLAFAEEDVFVLAEKSKEICFEVDFEIGGNCVDEQRGVLWGRVYYILENVLGL